MNRILGILGLFLFVFIATWLAADVFSGERASFLTAYNQSNMIRRVALFGIISIGVAFVIITGGIDLSIGSVICLAGVGFPWLVYTHEWPVWLALLAVMTVSAGIGLFHGLLITRLKLTPFVVTLCGLLMYRGLARGFTEDQSMGLGNDPTVKAIAFLGGGTLNLGWFKLPVPCLILAAIAIVAGIFLNRTVWGRHLLALGNNEEAARLSGINTNRLILLSYVTCSGLAGLAGLLFFFDVTSAQPSDFGNFYELYAIAAAVLGGCSLRGGQGSIVGVVLGAAVMRYLANTITQVSWIPNNIEFLVIGVVILLGVITDELTRRAVARRRRSQQLG